MSTTIAPPEDELPPGPRASSQGDNDGEGDSDGDEFERRGVDDHGDDAGGAEVVVADRLGTIERSLVALEQRLERLPGDEALDAEERALLPSVVLALDELFARVDEDIDAGDIGPDLRARRDRQRDRFEELRAQVVTRTGVPIGSSPPPSATRTSRRPSTLTLVGTGVTILGLLLVGFVVFQFWATDLSEQRSQRDLVGPFEQRLLEASAEEAGVGENASAEAFEDFGGGEAYAEAQEQAEEEAEVDTGPPPRGTPVALLQIPDIGVEKIVVEGTGAEDLKLGPGRYRDSAMPGHEGNAVIAGKRTTYGEPFRRLDELEEGDEITVVTVDGVSTYVVADSTVVEPGDPDVLAPGDGNTLTLVTAHPEYQAEQRMVVVAELEGDPFPTEEVAEGTDERPPPLTPDETGLARDVAAWAPVLLWGELLLGAAIVAGMLYRRWERWSAWLVTTPVLLALAYLWFESLNRLLPSTL